MWIISVASFSGWRLLFSNNQYTRKKRDLKLMRPLEVQYQLIKHSGKIS